MGIQHFDELNFEKFTRWVDNPDGFDFSEKVDGSNLFIYCDGRIATSRENKGGERYFDVNDWPNQHWSGTFRAAHLAAQRLLTGLLQEGEWMEVEIIAGPLPNTVPHLSQVNKLVVLNSNMTYERQTILTWLAQKNQVVVTEQVPTSQDGKTITYLPRTAEWTIVEANSLSTLAKLDVLARIRALLAEVREWMHRGSPETQPATVLKLRAGYDRKTRQVFLEEFQGWKQKVKRALLDALSDQKSQFDLEWIEGWVVSDGTLTFKLVDKEIFTKVNRFTHWAKSALVGSTYRRRSCVRTRIANWNSEQRAARLDVLVARYLRHKDKLRFTLPSGTIIKYDGELDRRVRVLLASMR